MEEANKEPLESQEESVKQEETTVIKEKPKTTLNFKVILFGIIIALIITFTLQNNAEVEVDFLFWQFTSVRAVIIFLAFGLGWLSAFIYGLSIKRKKKK